MIYTSLFEIFKCSARLEFFFNWRRCYDIFDCLWGLVVAVGWYNARIRAENTRIEEIEAERREAVESYYEKGNETLDENLYDLAIVNFSKAAEIDPDFVKGYEGLDRAYSGQYNEFAIEYANKALSIDPDTIIAFKTLSWVNFQQNKETFFKSIKYGSFIHNYQIHVTFTRFYYQI